MSTEDVEFKLPEQENPTLVLKDEVRFLMGEMSEMNLSESEKISKLIEFMVHRRAENHVLVPRGETLPVVVTTAQRGVFFGYAKGPVSMYDDVIILGDCRSCLAWSSTMKGFLGLEKVGPDEHSRVSMAAPRVGLKNITHVGLCTPEATANWEKAPWSEK